MIARLILLVSLLGSGAYAAATPPLYQVQALDGSFAGESYASDLNDAGQVVGTATENGISWPFVFRNGAFELFGAGSGIGETGTGLAISPTGLIAGRYVDATKALPYDSAIGKGYFGRGVFFIDGNVITRPRDLQDFTGTVGGNFIYSVYGFIGDSQLQGALTRSNSGAFYVYDFALSRLSLHTGGYPPPRVGSFGGSELKLVPEQRINNTIVPGGISVEGTTYKLQDLIDSSSDFIVSSGTQINASGQIAATGRDVGGRNRAILLTPTAWPAEMPPPTPVSVSPPPTPPPTATPGPTATPETSPTPGPQPTPSLQLLNGRLNGKFTTSTSRYVLNGTSRGASLVQVHFRGKTRTIQIRPNGKWSVKVAGFRREKNRVSVVAWNPATKTHSKAGTVVIVRR